MTTQPKVERLNDCGEDVFRVRYDPRQYDVSLADVADLVWVSRTEVYVGLSHVAVAAKRLPYGNVIGCNDSGLFNYRY